jgi:hypothetical protein
MRIHLVFAMAVCAVRCVGIFLEIGLAVSALEIIFGDLGVTVGAVRFSDSLAWPMFLRINVRVTLDTRYVSMCRILNVLFVDCQRNLLAIHCLEHVIFFVAD